MLKPLSFEESVRLFKLWGFVVEPGPQPGEVSLILEGADHRTYAVYEADMLPEVAAVALRVRWQNGAYSPTPSPEWISPLSVSCAHCTTTV